MHALMTQDHRLPSAEHLSESENFQRTLILLNQDSALLALCLFVLLYANQAQDLA